VTQAFSGAIDGLDDGTIGISAERVAAAAVLGGTTSALTGGKFANGAITGAFSRAFNDELHGSNSEKIVDDFGATKIGNQILFTDGQGVRMWIDPDFLNKAVLKNTGPSTSLEKVLEG
jgi:hypothetical protein